MTDKDLRSATDEQNAQVERECLAAALSSLRTSLGEQSFALDQRVTWKRFRAAMDEAEKAVDEAENAFCARENLDFAYVDDVHVCASALHALIEGREAGEVHPYSAAVMHVLAFGRWMAVREARLTLELAEDEGVSTLGDESSPETGEASRT